MSDKKLNTQSERFSYAIGLSVASNLIGSNVKSIDTSAFNLAIEDAYKGNMPQISPDDANKIIQDFFEHTKDESKTPTRKKVKSSLLKLRIKKGSRRYQEGCCLKSLNRETANCPF